MTTDDPRLLAITRAIQTSDGGLSAGDLAFNIFVALYGTPTEQATHTHAHAAADDSRFTAGLLADLQAVLERHGYRLPAETRARHRALAAHMVAALDLVRAFEHGDPRPPEQSASLTPTPKDI